MNTNSFVFVLKHEALEVWLRTKIYEQANFNISGPQIIQNLGLVRWVESADCLEFEQNNLIHDQISLVLADCLSAKPNWCRHLPCNRESRLAETHSQGFLVNSFKKPVTKVVIHSVENADNVMTQIPVFSFVFIRVNSRLTHPNPMQIVNIAILTYTPL